MKTLTSVDSKHSALWVDPERVSGEPCFTGTRVPVRILFEYLMAGETLNEFLAGFPSVSEEQARAVLHEALQSLINCATENESTHR